MRRLVVVALLALAASAGCGALLGLDDITYRAGATEGGAPDAGPDDARVEASGDGTSCGCPTTLTAPHTIASAQANPDFVRVTSQYVYWVVDENGAAEIRRCALAGSTAPEVVHRELGQITSLAVGGGFILFGNGGEVLALREDGSAYTCPTGPVIEAGVPILVAGNAGQALDLTVRGGEAWWIDDTSPDIEADKVPPNCEQDLFTRSADEPGLRHVRFDSAKFYWNGQSAIQSCAVSPGCRSTTPDVVVANSGAVQDLAVDSTYVYWSTGADIKRAPLIGPTDGGATLTTIGDPRALLVAGDALFVGDHGSGGRVVRVDAADGGQRVVAAGVPGPTSLAADTAHVYFTSKEGGRVMCVPR